MNKTTGSAFRFSTLLFAVALGFQSAWLLLAELSRVDAKSAAEIGAIRGDLWAESAFTYRDLMWGDAEGGAKLAQAYSSLDHALSNAPHQSSTWLMLAVLASRYRSLGVDPKEAVRMSYYTGPSELELMPLRLWIAAHLDAFSDVELRDFINREVRLLITHNAKSAIVAAYNAAQLAGRQLIEQTVREIDPTAVESLRVTTQKSPVPN
jgi:hypothetical protein